MVLNYKGVYYGIVDLDIDVLWGFVVWGVLMGAPTLYERETPNHAFHLVHKRVVQIFMPLNLSNYFSMVHDKGWRCFPQSSYRIYGKRGGAIHLVKIVQAI